MSRLGFLSLSTKDFGGRMIVCGGGCPVHFRMFGNISVCHPLDVSRIPPYSPVATTKNVSER